MYIMPNRRCGSELKEPKDILERMQWQLLMATMLGATSTSNRGYLHSLCLSTNNVSHLQLE